MSSGFQVSTFVDAPIDAVWDRLSDLDRASDWMNSVESMRLVSDGQIGNGSKIVFQARGSEHESIVTGWSPPNQLELTSRQGGLTATYRYDCQPEASGTRLSLTADCVADGFLRRLMGPLIGFMMKRTDSGQVHALKSVVESALQAS